MKEYSNSIPKPTPIFGYRPILRHLMKYYAQEGLSAIVVHPGQCGITVRRELSSQIKHQETRSHHDVRLPSNQLANTLYAKQYKHSRGKTWLEELLSLPEFEEHVSCQSAG